MVKEILLKSLELPNGEIMAYRQAGEGDKVLILVHGNYSSSIHLDAIMENMPDGYKMYAPDMRGFGDTTYNNPISSLKELAADIKLFVDKLGLKKFNIFGWSLGGGVVLQFAADYPEYLDKTIISGSVGVKGYPLYKTDASFKLTTERVKTMEELKADPVIAAPVLGIYKNHDKANLKAIFDAAIFTKSKPSDEKYDAYLEATFKQRNLVEADYALMTFNMTHENNGVVDGSGDIDKIKGPVLVIQGTEDGIVSAEQFETIKDGLGDRAEIKEFQGCGHAPMIDKLDEFMNVIVTFMEK
ncbi:intracellular short-chain-length polyhydroxyalkanoate depolymerase [Clostridium sp. JNZ J1-5]